MPDTFFERFPDTVRMRGFDGGLVFGWSRTGIGFGELTLAVKDGRLVMDTENMSDAFCLAVIAQAMKERHAA